MSGSQIQTNTAAYVAGMTSIGKILMACVNTSLEIEEGKSLMGSTGKFVVVSIRKIFHRADA